MLAAGTAGFKSRKEEKLNRYEVIAIVKSDLPDEDITTILERYQAIITERKGVIAKAEKWGKRRLAYEIKKQKDGFYLFIDFAGNGPIVNEVERNFKIDDRILKFMTVKKEGAVTQEGIEAEIAAAEAKKTQATAAAQENASASKDEKSSEEAPRPQRISPRKPAAKEESTVKGE